METYDPKQVFLEHFPANRRSHIANLFLGIIRNGENDPVAVVYGVIAKARQERSWRSRSAYGRDDIPKWDAIIEEIQWNHDEAIACAQSYIDWEMLPIEKRDAIKAERSSVYRAQYMSQLPPTDKQISYLLSMGVRRDNLPTDRAAASEAIDALLRERDR